MEWFFWPPAQAINFLFLPPHLRVIYVNVLIFGWDSFLSYMKHRDQKLPVIVHAKSTKTRDIGSCNHEKSCTVKECIDDKRNIDKNFTDVNKLWSAEKRVVDDKNRSENGKSCIIENDKHLVVENDEYYVVAKCVNGNVERSDKN